MHMCAIKMNVLIILAFVVHETNLCGGCIINITLQYFYIKISDSCVSIHICMFVCSIHEKLFVFMNIF